MLEIGPGKGTLALMAVEAGWRYRAMEASALLIAQLRGLGLEVTQEDGLVKVVTPIDDTPASRAGVKTGDFISAIDGTSIQGMPLNEAVERMRGPEN